MSAKVTGKEDIDKKFAHPGSLFTYTKPAAVIRMMEGILGRSTLIKGLSNYLAARQFNNSVAEQLFGHLEAAGHKDGSWPQEGVKHQSLATTMRVWTDQVDN
jgi:aminopeptidase N